MKTGRPSVSPDDKAVGITISSGDLRALDQLIAAELGTAPSPSELAKYRRDFIGAMIRTAAPRALMDLRKRVEGSLDQLTRRVEAVERPYLDYIGELLMLKDEVKNIEAQTIGGILKRLEILENE